MPPLAAQTKPSSHPLLRKLLTEKALRQRAGKAYYDRGVAYWQQGHVHQILESDGVVTADVFGSQPYRVRLWAHDQQLDYDCSCPLGEDGDFCKHCVAVALAWQHPSPTESGQPRKATPPSVARADTRPPLNTLSDADTHRLRARLTSLRKQDLMDLLGDTIAAWGSLAAFEQTVWPPFEARRAGEDLLTPYYREASGFIDRRTPQAYEQALRFLKKTRASLRYTGQTPAFDTLIARLAQEHAQKRTFIALLMKAGWL